MSLVPLLLSDLLDEVHRPVDLFDQNFGLGMLHDDIINPSVVGPLRIGYYRPWRNQAARRSGVSNLQNTKGFKVRNSSLYFIKCVGAKIYLIDNAFSVFQD